MSDPNYPQYPSANQGDAYGAPSNEQDSAQHGQYQQAPYQAGQSQPSPHTQGQSRPGTYPQDGGQYGPGQQAYEQPYRQPYQQAYHQPGQQPGQPVQYGQPAWRPTDGFSIAALVTSLLGFNVVAIVLGIIGLNRTKNGAMSGRGMAIAGIVIGSLWFVAIIILMIFYFSLVAASYTW